MAVSGKYTRILTLADIKQGPLFIQHQRSRRIQTRTKGKRKMRRIVQDYMCRMERQIQEVAWNMWHYKAMGKYP